MFCENAEEMNMAERMFVDETWILRSDTYNLCKGGEGEKREEYQDSQANESEESESEKEEAITYMDDAVATENYYPS